MNNLRNLFSKLCSFVSTEDFFRYWYISYQTANTGEDSTNMEIKKHWYKKEGNSSKIKKEKKDRNAVSSSEFLSFSFSSSSDRSFEVTKKANIIILNMSSFCHTVCRLLTIWTEYYVCACQNLKIIFYLFLNSLDFYHCQSIIERFVIKITKTTFYQPEMTLGLQRKYGLIWCLNLT